MKNLKKESEEIVNCCERIGIDMATSDGFQKIIFKRHQMAINMIEKLVMKYQTIPVKQPSFLDLLKRVLSQHI